MQDYRIARPHDPAVCADCARTGLGHNLCQGPGCEQLAAHQTVRHATQAEYDAIPPALVPIDGIALMRVDACEDCHDKISPHCAHEQAALVPCPKCGADGLHSPCVKADGKSPRDLWHRDRHPTAPAPCRHAHAEACPVFGGCTCAASPVVTSRAPRVVRLADDAHINTAKSKVPSPIAKVIVEAHDIPWWTVRYIDTRKTQDNQPALYCEYAQIDAEGNVADDGHGHEVLKNITIPLVQGAAPQPVVHPPGPAAPPAIGA